MRNYRNRLILISLIYSTNLFSQVNIWKDTDAKLYVEMVPYLATKHSNIAVIVCPGGSYFWHDMNAEGEEVAQWLNRNGISAFVLKYRTANTIAFILHYRYLFRGNRFPDPLDDLHQTIKFLKLHADEYCINPNMIGVLGFSAGGHLALSAAELLESKDRPAFVAAIYPVISMSDICTHKRSRRGLLGENRAVDKNLQDSLSLEHHIPKDCPPVFVANCLDDPVVEPRNSELIDSALSTKNIPHQYVQFKTGGHGFGASDEKGTVECRQWKSLFLDWLSSQFY